MILKVVVRYLTLPFSTTCIVNEQDFNTLQNSENHANKPSLHVFFGILRSLLRLGYPVLTKVT